MTAIVGIRCSNGVVIGADSSITSCNLVGQNIMETDTKNKITIVGNQFILAGSGQVGYNQRFQGVIETLFSQKSFQGLSDLEIGKLLSAKGIEDFKQTHVANLEYSALVAFPSTSGPALCELPGGRTGFQPELKNTDGLWFASIGGGQGITDPILALFRNLFWEDGPPSLEGGMFTAAWALDHACRINPGGINSPIHLAVLENAGKGQYRARFLSADELAEQDDLIRDSFKHFSKFKEILEGTGNGPLPPKP